MKIANFLNKIAASEWWTRTRPTKQNNWNEKDSLVRDVIRVREKIIVVCVCIFFVFFCAPFSVSLLRGRYACVTGDNLCIKLYTFERLPEFEEQTEKFQCAILAGKYDKA